MARKQPRWLLLFAGAACLTALLWGAANSRAQEIPRDPAAIWTYLNGLSGAERKSVMEREAAKEHGITVYGATGIDQAQFWIKQFNIKYPQLNVEFVRQTETDLVQKLTAEARAGQSHADVVIETATYLPLLKSLLAPYAISNLGEIDPRFAFGDVRQGWTAYSYLVFPETIAWRTDRIAAAEVPKSLEDLADSKLADRVGTTPNIARLATGLSLALGEDRTKALLEKLAALRNKVYGSHAALADGLSSGEIDLAWDLVALRGISLKSQGAPVDWKLMQPLFAESNAIAAVKTTHNPFTTALFIDAMMSKESSEAADQWQGGQFYGNKTANYKLALKDFPNLTIFPLVEPAELKRWELLGERLFIRRQ